MHVILVQKENLQETVKYFLFIPEEIGGGNTVPFLKTL